MKMIGWARVFLPLPGKPWRPFAWLLRGDKPTGPRSKVRPKAQSSLLALGQGEMRWKLRTAPGEPDAYLHMWGSEAPWDSQDTPPPSASPSTSMGELTGREYDAAQLVSASTAALFEKGALVVLNRRPNRVSVEDLLTVRDMLDGWIEAVRNERGEG